MTFRSILLSCFTLLATVGMAQPGAAVNQKDAQGHKQGPWQRNWAESSQLRYTGQFKNDKPVGDFIYYSTTGKVESRIDHYVGSDAAHAKHFHPDGKLLAEGRYVGEDKDSTWNYYDTDGILRSTEHWKKGKMEAYEYTGANLEYALGQEGYKAAAVNLNNDVAFAINSTNDRQ